jgi:hypothetical protein
MPERAYVDDEYLPELGGAYLEDSYFLGLVAEGKNLRLNCLLALTAQHSGYAPPRPGEQHCYREGSIVLEDPLIVEWRSGKPTITRDSDGTFDFGSIELYRRGPGHFRFVTQWFDATVEAKQLSLQLSEANV